MADLGFLSPFCWKKSKIIFGLGAIASSTPPLNSALVRAEILKEHHMNIVENLNTGNLKRKVRMEKFNVV